MKTIGTVIGAAVPASLAAGPLYVLSNVAALIYGQLPQPIVVDLRDALAVALFLIPATIVGFMIAFWVNIVGARIMSILADRSETCREPVV